MNQNGQNGRICAEEYVVKRGDSFYLIAHKLGVPLRDLLAANRDIHPARLMVGDVLCIPREEDDSPESGGLGGGDSAGNGNTGGSAGNNGSGTPENGPDGNTGTGNENNQPGMDNTGSVNPAPNCPIEQQYSVENGQTVEDIQLRNLLSRHTLETANPGVNLDVLKAGQVLCVPTENVPCTIPNSYTLGRGETLEAVAVKFNLPVGSLLRANPCLAPQDFEEGACVVLPSR
ncbi:MAG: LysM peptidoglycan-binding domain-containing protein [Clostridiales bacterium]|nr:LysM peptidoglycan-binding domain-containing protein [Clostridiales bacterium]